MNQEELVRRLQIKDIMAFKRLYDMYRHTICGVVNTIVKDKSLAEEITQNVFTKVWNEAHHYRPSKGRFFSWVLNIARKAAIEELTSTPYEDTGNKLSTDYLLGFLNDDEKTSGFKKLVKNLERKNIEIFDLLYFKGYTQRETSEVLGIPLNKVIKSNRRCILKIRDNMTFEWI